MSTRVFVRSLNVNSKYPRELNNHNCEEFLGYEPFAQLTKQKAELSEQRLELHKHELQ